MSKTKEQITSELIANLDDCIFKIVNGPNNPENYKILSDTIMRSLPYLSNRESSFFPERHIVGFLGDKYIINYNNLFGVVRQMSVNEKTVQNEKGKMYIIKDILGFQSTYERSI